MAEIAPSVPPVTATSPALPFQTKPAGASLKLKLIVAVWPDLSVLTLLVIASVGATVSIAKACIVWPAPGLPAASE